MAASFREHRTLLLICGLAAVIRLTTAIPLHQATFTSDEKEYILLATRMIDDHMFLDSNNEWSVKPPGFPALLAGMFEIFGRSLIPLLLLNAILGALAALLGYFVVREFSGDQVAPLVSAAILALHPSLVIYGAVLQSEALYIDVLLLAILLSMRMMRKPAFSLAIGLGLLLAVLILIRAIGLAVAGALFATLIFVIDAPLQKRFQIIAAGVLAVAIGLTPWTLRNYSIHHAFVPVSTFSGTSLLIGNNPYSEGTTALPPQYFAWVDSEATRRGLPEPATMTEVDREHFHRDVALAWIVGHPAEWSNLLLKKLEVFWIYPVTTTAENHKVQAVAMAADALLWLGALAGILVLWKDRRVFLLFSIVIVSVTFAHVIMHTEARYRLPLVALLGIFFGPGSMLILQHPREGLRNSSRGALVSAGVVALLLMIGYLAAGVMFLHGEV